MSYYYLLAVEADKIQDIIFQASRLREIEGGSQLLTNWCAKMKNKMLESGIAEENIIVADGGAFRVIFNDEKSCMHWGEVLAENYGFFIGGTISVARPVCFIEGEFGTANQKAQQELQRAKNAPRARSACLHNPYVSYCNVCGVGLGVTTGDIYKRQIMCSSCARKLDLIKGEKPSDVPTLRERFLRIVQEKLPNVNLYLPDTIEKIGNIDDRANVAHLVADGNEMGVLFSRCNHIQMKELSRELGRIMIESLGEVTSLLIQRVYSAKIAENRPVPLPVLPLILGGDDLYILLAAPYSLDFTRRFTQTYINAMKNLLEKLEISFNPSICSGLLICKAKYPHTTAYERAHERLVEAKYFARRTEEEEECRQLISFGNTALYEHEKEFLNTLKPYSLEDSLQKDNYLPIKELLDCRYVLKNVPASRLEDLYLLYDYAYLPQNPKTAANWQEQFSFHLSRAGRKQEDLMKINHVLQRLGSLNKDLLYMREIKRQKSVKATGLPDLFEFWDYAQDLDRAREEYESES